MANVCSRSCWWRAACCNTSDFRGAGTLRIPHGFTRRQICLRSRFERQRSALSPRRGRTPKPAGLVAERYLDYLVRRRSLGLCVPRRKNLGTRISARRGKRQKRARNDARAHRLGRRNGDSKRSLHARREILRLFLQSGTVGPFPGRERALSLARGAKFAPYEIVEASHGGGIIASIGNRSLARHL